MKIKDIHAPVPIQRRQPFDRARRLLDRTIPGIPQRDTPAKEKGITDKKLWTIVNRDNERQMTLGMTRRRDDAKRQVADCSCFVIIHLPIDWAERKLEIGRVQTRGASDI